MPFWVPGPAGAESGGASVLPQGWVHGLETARNGTTSIDVDAGIVFLSDLAMQLPSLITKTEGAWAVGTNQGGLDDGTAYMTSTWYFVWLIRRSDTGGVDVLFSASNSAPTMPSGYDQKALIWAFYVNSGGTIDPYTQSGDIGYWPSTIVNLNTTSPATSWTAFTVSVPPLAGVVVTGYGFVRQTTGTARAIGFTHGDDNPGADWWNGVLAINCNSGVTNFELNNVAEMMVNGNGQIKYNASAGTSIIAKWSTKGWVFPRGRV